MNLIHIWLTVRASLCPSHWNFCSARSTRYCPLLIDRTSINWREELFSKEWNSQSAKIRWADCSFTPLDVPPMYVLWQITEIRPLRGDTRLKRNTKERCSMHDSLVFKKTHPIRSASLGLIVTRNSIIHTCLTDEHSMRYFIQLQWDMKSRIRVRNRNLSVREPIIIPESRNILHKSKAEREKKKGESYRPSRYGCLPLLVPRAHLHEQPESSRNREDAAFIETENHHLILSPFPPLL